MRNGKPEIRHFFSLLIPYSAFLIGAAAAVGLFLRGPGGAESAAWHNIGGCGSSGGGAAAGAGKWIGRGATGGLVDLEVLGNVTLGGDYLYDAAAFNTTYHYPRLPAWTAGLSLNFKAATFEYEGYKVSTDPVPALERQAGGFGDLGLSLNRLFGEGYHHSIGLSLGLPTGQHDIKRLHQKSGLGADGDDRRWLNPFVQPGSGLYSLGVTYEFTQDHDWGLFVFGGSYTSAWAWDNQSCRDVPGSVTDKVVNCREEAPSPLTWKLWELKHQDWNADPATWLESEGAPGTGATGADVISLYAYVGHKEEASTQSVGLTLNVPMSPTYYWEMGSVDPVSQRIRTNDYVLKVSAGLEITHPSFPIFLSVGVPWRLAEIADRGRLVSPMNYVGTLGLRGTFF
jgi:hypothetical protein